MEFTVDNIKLYKALIKRLASLCNPHPLTPIESTIKIKADEETNRVILSVMDSRRYLVCLYAPATVSQSGEVFVLNDNIKKLTDAVRQDVLIVRYKEDEGLVYDLGLLGCKVTQVVDDDIGFPKVGLTRTDIDWSPALDSCLELKDLFDKVSEYVSDDFLTYLSIESDSNSVRVSGKGTNSSLVQYTASSIVSDSINVYISPTLSRQLGNIASDTGMSIYKADDVDNIYRLETDNGYIIFHGEMCNSSEYELYKEMMEWDSISNVEISYDNLLDALSWQAYGMRPYEDIQLYLNTSQDLEITGSLTKEPATLVTNIPMGEWPTCNIKAFDLIKLVQSIKANKGNVSLSIKSDDEDSGYWFCIRPVLVSSECYPVGIIGCSIYE
jgi:hypothetical protein